MAKGATILLIILIGGCGVMLASQPPDTLPGFKPNNLLESRGVDNVNPFSGDPGIVVPLGPEYPLSAGNSWQLKAYYSAKFWHFDTDCPQLPDGTLRHAVISGYPTLGAGWSLELGYVNVRPDVGSYALTYHSPDSGLHAFISGLTIDGSHLRITSISGGYRVDFPDGSSQTFDHAYSAPTPVPGSAFSYDFNDVDWEFVSTQGPRYGLTSIKDSFDTTILTVNYVASSPSRDAWRVSQVNLKPNSPDARSITYTWGTKQIGTIGAVTWDVLNSISLPTANGSLQVSFAYDISGGSGDNPTFQRDSYDNSVALQRCINPGTVFVPLLDTMTLSAPSITSMSYQFRYLLNTDPGPYFGTLKHIVLPTQGVIDYTYGATTGTTCFGSQCADPETDSGTFGPVRPLTPNQQDYTRFWDDNPAVVSRTETDPITGLTSTAAYSRYQLIPLQGDLVTPDEQRITRRTIVTAPTGNGSGQVATRYLFHVEVNPFLQGSGIELERIFYADASPTGSPIRTLINCHEADTPPSTCGFRDGSGNIQPYSFQANARRQNEVTWYGVRPVGSDGGSCPVGGASRCSQSSSSAYNATAGKYGTTTVTSNLLAMPGWTSRISTTLWNPQTSPKYLLNLYTEKTETELSTVDQYFDFNASNGFLSGSANRDQSRSRILINCRYPDPSDSSIAKTDFVATIDFFSSPPPSGFCSSGPYATMPANVIGINGDAFGRQHAYQDGLVKQSFWLFSSAGQNFSIGWNSFDVDREAATGLITASRDPAASLQTTYAYDALGRITAIAPPAEASTAITYDSANQTTVTRTGGDGNSTWQRFLYDGFGRLIRDIRQVTTGYAVRVHTYDGAGHASFVSEWAGCSSPTNCSTASASSGTTSSSYDPLGRPQSVTRADLSVTTISYADPDVNPAITVSDSRKSVTVCVGALNCSPGATTVYRYDPLGRLITVTEPSGDSASYIYDVNGKLTQVTQTQVSPPATQVRSFTYDPFGFLRSETTPEKGPITYGSVYPTSGYGGLGNLRRKAEGGGANVNLTFFHDAAGRVACETDGLVSDATTTSCSVAAGTRYVSYFYDGTGFAGGSYPAGKLTQRIGYNPGKPSAVTEQFTYSDPTGRLSSKNILIDTTPQGTISVSESWSYNSLGLIANHTHPYRAGADAAVTSTYSYSSGLPTGLTVGGQTRVSGVTYSPSAVITSWTAGNGMTTTISQDASGIPRPTRILSSVSGFDTGSYSYDGAGNILAMGADVFGYDSRSRLTSSTVSGAPLTYSYDAFGNLSPSGVDPGTNHLKNGLYDGRGNLVAAGSQTFAYDAFSRQTAAGGGAAPATGAPERYLYDGAGERIARVNGGGDLYTISPCRVLDTRSSPPAIPGGGSRTVQVTGTCGVPAGAVGIAGNVTVVGASGAGFLILSAAETTPSTSVINYDLGMTRANNFQVALSPSGQVQIAAGVSSTDAILDVTGYFISPPSVETWNLTFRDQANRLSSEYTVGASVTRTKDYFYFGNLLVGTRDGSGDSYYSTDHLGTPRLVSGSLSECHKYQPFGQEIGCSFGNQPLKFAAMERDSSSGMDYDHARYSSSTQGRFLSPDVLGGRLSDPQSWNRFSYATNNPIIALDPDGLETTVYIVGTGRKMNELLGHAMLAVQSARGTGYLSQTLKPPAFQQGLPDAEIGHYLDEGRRVTAIRLTTSATFDQALYDYISTAAFGSYNLITRNCAESICRSLGNVGFELGRPEAILSPLELGLALRATPYVVTITTYSSSTDFYGNYRTSVSVTTYNKTRLTLDLPGYDPRRWLLSMNDLIHQRNVLVEGISLAR